MAADLPYDVALVCFTRSSYAAAQRIRRDLGMAGSDDAVLRDVAERLRAAQVTLFVGAGASTAAGLPAWKGLLAALAAEAARGDPDVRWREGFESLALIDQAELLTTARARRLGGRTLATLVREQLDQQVNGQSPRPSLQQWLLAGLGTSEVVTTNFDLLLDRALTHVARPDPVRVLPWDPVGVGDRWILKLHGDVEHGAITLSRDDYLGYDALRRPLASVVQAQLLTRHMLMVGFSLDDDNFIRLARGVRSMLAGIKAKPSPEALATALMPGHQPARERLWDGAVRFVPAWNGTEGAESYRRVEIWLDNLAPSCADDYRYLLDPDYRGMLSASDRALAGALTALPATWTTSVAAPEVDALLRSLGHPGPSAEIRR